MAALSARLLEEREVLPRARITAQILADALPGSAVNVYAVAPLPEGDVWAVLASAGAAAAPESAIPLQTGTLGILARDLKPLLFDGRSVSREDYAHVNVRRTLRSLGYLPLMRNSAENDALIGAIEILSFENPLSQAQMDDLSAVGEVFSAALFGAQIYENEHHNTLESISRLTQLYDIEKVFSSTLEMDQLFPIIGSKVREMLECEAVNLWLLEADESLRLMHQSGDDFTVRVGALQRPGEGVAGDVSDNGEAVLIEHSDDERLLRRNMVSPNAGEDEGEADSGGVKSLIVAAIMDQESLVGVIEAVNKLDGSAFDEDELFTLSRLTESAAIALHNASLLAAERKVEVLETLVTVSHEITSTLNLERMLQTIVNAPQAVIPYERAAVALEHHGKYQAERGHGSHATRFQCSGNCAAQRHSALGSAGRGSDPCKAARRRNLRSPPGNPGQVPRPILQRPECAVSTPCHSVTTPGESEFWDWRAAIRIFYRPRIWKFCKCWRGRPPSPCAMRRCTRKCRSSRCWSRCSSASANSWPWKNAAAP